MCLTLSVYAKYHCFMIFLRIEKNIFTEIFSDMDPIPLRNSSESSSDDSDDYSEVVLIRRKYPCRECDHQATTKGSL